MKNIEFICVVALSILASCAGESDENHEIHFTAGIDNQIEKLVDAQFRQGDFHGSILVAKGDSIIFTKGYGLSNPHSVNGPDTPFKIASLTKPLTAALILKLYQEHKLDIHASVSEYLPEYSHPESGKITIHYLLSHSSGIPDYTRLPGSDSLHRQTVSPEKLMAFFENEPLNFTPGERFEYSNSGYAVLGLIAERVTGKEYGALLDEYLFEPLGMTRSGYFSGSGTHSWNAADSSLILREEINMSVPYAAGGVQSTVMDLFTFNRALSGGDLFPDSLTGLLFRPQADEYGYGWFVRKVPSFTDPGKQLTVADHGGMINGFVAQMTRIMEDDILIISLNNTGSAQLFPLHVRIARLLYGGGSVDPEGELIQIH